MENESRHRKANTPPRANRSKRGGMNKIEKTEQVGAGGREAHRGYHAGPAKGMPTGRGDRLAEELQTDGALEHRHADPS